MELEEISRKLSKNSVRDLASAIIPPNSGNDNGSTSIPVAEDSEARSPTREQIKKSRYQLSALFWCLFLAGWNDGTTGPLLPRMQTFYHVGFALVSLIFVFACIGFISGALLNVPMTDKLGFGKVIVIGSLCQIIAYAIQAAQPPFPVFVMAFVINGVGIALQDAQANGYVASLKTNAEAKMGLLHAAYGVGAFVAPLVSTQFSQAKHWSLHYLTSLCVAIVNAIILVIVFRFKKQEECLADIGQASQDRGTSEHSTFHQILKIRAVHLLAFFILVYVGVEVTIGGWIVTFIINVRHGGPSAGYISSGFFGGLALGRVLLLWVNKKVGERRVLFIYAGLAISLELVVWLVPSLVGDAVAVSIVGLLLGPMYPITMNQAGRILPHWLLTGSIGWIAGFGQAGSAVLPFMTGAISSKHGIQSLQPLLVSMMAFMVLLWALVPKAPRRLD